MQAILDRETELTNEWNHSCGPACGNCGNPNNIHAPKETDADRVDLLPRLDAA